MDDPTVICDLTAELDYESQSGLTALLVRHLDLPAEAIASSRLLMRSLDARHRRFRYQIRAELTLREASTARALVERGRVQWPDAYDTSPGRDGAVVAGLKPGSQPLSAPPLVVGTGPAGLFAAWLLAEYGYQPIVFERGPRVEKRIRDVRSFEKGGPFEPESNILFGEGGAGTFSDGKLTCRTKAAFKPTLLDLMIECTAPDEIRYMPRAHIGTDRLRAVLIHLRRKLEAKGVQFYFDSRVDDLLLDSEGAVRGIRLADGRDFSSPLVLLAIGHSARDSYEMLLSRGVAMEFKPFQLGLRVEHPQAMVDTYRYGGEAEELALPSAEYALKTRVKALGRELFSFCMCPGGYIVPSVSQSGYLCTNGMSRHRRDSGWANSGLVYTITAEDLGRSDPLAGVREQERIERIAFEMSHSYAVPAQRIPDFIKGRVSKKDDLKTTWPLGHHAADLTALLPGPGAKLLREGLQQLDRSWRGYSSKDGILVGPEARGSSPLRMPRDNETRISISTPGLYPMGEGAGYAGGILSAAIDGVRSAQAIIERYAPIKS